MVSSMVAFVVACRFRAGGRCVEVVDVEGFRCRRAFRRSALELSSLMDVGSGVGRRCCCCCRGGRSRELRERDVVEGSLLGFMTKSGSWALPGAMSVSNPVFMPDSSSVVIARSMPGWSRGGENPAGSPSLYFGFFDRSSSIDRPYE